MHEQLPRQSAPDRELTEDKCCGDITWQPRQFARPPRLTALPLILASTRSALVAIANYCEHRTACKRCDDLLPMVFATYHYHECADD